MTSEARPASRRSVSLLGPLALCSGLGLILALRKFDRVFEDWSPVLRFLLFAIVVILLFAGLKQTLTAIWPSLGNHSLRRVNRHRVLLPREGMVFLLIMVVMFVGSLLGRSNMLMLIFALMAGPFVLNGWITFTLLKRTTATRSLPRRAMAGQLVSVELTLHNPKRLFSSWLMVARDRISNRREQLEASVLFTRVPPCDRRSGYYQMRLGTRGRYTLGPVEVSTRFPLGLIERGLVCDVNDEILVHPRIGQLSPRWKRDFLLATELVERRTTRRGSFDDEFHRLREYRWGDDPRAIHWRTTARRNELMVREYHQSRDLRLAVFLDLWIPPQPARSDLDAAELAVSFAATVCLGHLRQSRDSSLSLVIGGERIDHWEGQSSPAGIESMLDRLALAEPDSATQPQELLCGSHVKRSAQTLNLLVTTRHLDSSSASELREMSGLASGPEAGTQLQIVEADWRQLGAFFRLD